MSYSDTMNQLLEGQYFSIVVILDASGATYWTNQPAWVVDGPDVLKKWSGRSPSIKIGDTKFSSIKNEPGVTFVGKNIGGGGTVILQKCPNDYTFLTWSPADCPFEPINIQNEVSRMAEQFV